jgi:hypothetical protein
MGSVILPTSLMAAMLDLNQDAKQLRTIEQGGFTLEQSHGGDPAETFGPNSCVSVSRSNKGSCTISTNCGDNNISALEFAFVCYNPGTSVPHALHSFGIGGFEANEVFDSGVRCQRCSTVQNAFAGFDQTSMNLARSLPLGHTAPNGDLGTLKEMKPQEAAFYGPKACISTFRSPAGTCIVQTRCQNADISIYDVGITCLDKSGDYTRYLFGKGNFEKEETFDTRIECEVCLGVGAETGEQQIHGVLPKQLVEDVNTLKDEVLALKLEVRALQNGAGSTHPGTMKVEAPSPPLAAAKTAPKKELSNAEKGLDLKGEPLAPAPAMVAAPAEKLEAHEVRPFAGGKDEKAVLAGAPSAAAAPSQAPAPSHGGHHSLATIPSKISAMDVDDADEEEAIVVHHRRATPSPLQDLLRRLAN